MVNDTKNSDDIYEIKYLYESIKRNKKVFFTILFASISFSLIYGFTKEKIWEGEFQIVLRDQTKKNDILQTISSSSIIAESLNIGSKQNILTEVGVLKSASTLTPIFEYFKTQKNLNNIDLEDLTLKDWVKDSLKIELTRKTNILNMKFNDNDKTLIIPILNKISERYQSYSNKSRLRNLQLFDNYLNKQIKIYRIQSEDSLKEAQEFAINQDLYFPNNQFLNSINPQLSPESLRMNIGDYSNSRIKSQSIISNIIIEDNRIKAANDIKEIDLQIEKIKNLNDNAEVIQYIFYTIPAFNETSDKGFPQILEELELKLAAKRNIYLDRAEEIKSLIIEKNSLINLLKNKAISYLEAKRLVTNAKLEAATRPKDVLLKYKELLRKASRDEKTLVKLENDHRVVKLDLAMKKDPWELITKPTLSPYPISPNKKRILVIGSMLGLIFGTILSLLKDRNSNLLYNEKSLNKFFNIQKIIDLQNYSKDEWQILIVSMLLKYDLKGKKLAIHTIGNIDNDSLSSLLKNISTTDLKENYLISKNIIDLKKCDLFIIISSKGVSKINEISKSLKLIEFQNKENIGLFIL